jgi:hypothetical protein
MLDPATKLPCAIGGICSVLGMTFHGNIITPRHYTVAMINIKKRPVRLSFPNPDATKVINMGNGIIL